MSTNEKAVTGLGNAPDVKTIEIRKYADGLNHHRTDQFSVVGTIQRKLRAEQIGNFNPLFCTYKGNKRTLVHSDKGDLSDPFRREESYLTKLFIEA